MRVFCVILMSIGSDNLKEFVIGCSTVRTVIESKQEICDRSSNRTEGDRLQKFVVGDPIVRKVIDSKKFVTGRPTVQVDSEENSDQEVSQNWSPKSIGNLRHITPENLEMLK